MQTIESTRNPRIRQMAALACAKGRAETSCFLVEGIKLCEEALRDATVITLLVDKEKAPSFSSVMTQAKDVVLCPSHVLASVSTSKTPQGILAAVRLPQPLVLSSADGAYLALDGVQDPGNVGAMLRTAEAVGFRGILLSTACADAFSPKAVRASMGSVLRLPIWRGLLPDGIESLKQQGHAIICTALGGVAPDTATKSLGPRYVLVIGSEGNGISHEVLSLSSFTVSLKMHGRVESLNAAVAAGILMYHFMAPDRIATGAQQ